MPGLPLSIRRPERRGAPLWAYLTALVLIPLSGVVLSTVVTVSDRVAEAASAARAETAVRALAQLDAARSGVEQEMVPTVSLLVIDDPLVAGLPGFPTSVLKDQRATTVELLTAARTRTDDALADAVDSDFAAGATVARTTISALRTLRRQASAGELGVDELYLRYLSVSTSLAAIQQAAADDATAEGLPASTQRAVQDVQLVAGLAQASSGQVPLYLGGVLAATDSAVGGGLARETARLAYVNARDRMASLSQASLRTAWQEMSSSETFTTMDAALAPPSSTPSVTSGTELVPLAFTGIERDARIIELVGTAVHDAQARAEADRESAGDRAWTTLLWAVGLILAAVLGALLVGRAILRALRLLAGRAQQVGQGELVDVEVTGPREVRTVSTALGSAVASLRRVQGQAQAVARGDLSDPLLDQPLPGPLGKVVHASVQQMVRSVRQREELQSALAHQAAHDPLTELPNRSQALQLTAAALARGQRAGAMTGLLFVDLDAFKSVNDTHGHACGDEVLRRVAARLRDTVRSGDVVCRLGGDEFVVLVETVDDEGNLMGLAERLITAVSAPIVLDELVVQIGASVGVAISRDAGVDPDVLFAEADTAAYRAKRHGRGRAEAFDETLRAQLAERAALEAAITAGLQGGELELYYQPVVDVAADRLTGYEALIRWQRPGHGLVLPDEFIPAAEESSLICELDRWVLHEATRQLAAWRREAGVADGGPEPTIAVNISGRHLQDRRVVSDVAAALAASGLPAHLLVLEVTETVLVDEPAAMVHLAALRALGASIAIDDFGTGYTSIGQLGHMPVDILKIDRSFIRSVAPGHGELVALMIRAAHTFGLTVVAEGVEEPEQLARLKTEACDQAQGYLMSRPLPAAAAEALWHRSVGAAR